MEPSQGRQRKGHPLFNLTKKHSTSWLAHLRYPHWQAAKQKLTYTSNTKVLYILALSSSPKTKDKEGLPLSIRNLRSACQISWPLSPVFILDVLTLDPRFHDARICRSVFRELLNINFKGNQCQMDFKSQSVSRLPPPPAVRWRSGLSFSLQ